MLSDLIKRSGSRRFYGVIGQNIGVSPVAAPTGLDTFTGKKLDRCQNGNLWFFRYVYHANNHPVLAVKGGILEGWVSTNNGASWTLGYADQISSSTTNTQSAHASIFIDLDDYLHVVYVDTSGTGVKYRRGTPNASRTTYSMTSAYDVLSGGNEIYYPDIVAHRDGTGWKAHIVTSTNALSTSVHYVMITITNAGVISASAGTHIGSSYSNTLHRYPSIDFNHTGDGKTVAGGTPYLYCAWTGGSAVTGKGIRFKKSTYSGGVWGWNVTERAIDDARCIEAPETGFLKCMFDGTRVIIGGFLRDSGSTYDLVFYERDAADTTTVTREVLANQSTGRAYFSNFTYDRYGNYYHIARFTVGGAGHLIRRKFNRVSLAVEAVTVKATTDPNANFYPNFRIGKIGTSDDRIDLVYMDHTTSPATIVFEGIDAF